MSIQQENTFETAVFAEQLDIFIERLRAEGLDAQQVLLLSKRVFDVVSGLEDNFLVLAALSLTLRSLLIMEEVPQPTGEPD